MPEMAHIRAWSGLWALVRGTEDRVRKTPYSALFTKIINTLWIVLIHRVLVT